MTTNTDDREARVVTDKQEEKLEEDVQSELPKDEQAIVARIDADDNPDAVLQDIAGLQDAEPNHKRETETTTEEGVEDAAERIRSADRRLSEKHTPEDIADRPLVLVALEEEDLQNADRFTDLFKEYLPDVYTDGQKRFIINKARKTLLEARRRLARGTVGASPESFKLNKVAVINTLIDLEQSLKVPEPELIPIDTWEAPFHCKQSEGESGHFELYSITKPEAEGGHVSPDSITKELASLAKLKDPYGNDHIRYPEELSQISWIYCKVTTKNGEVVKFYMPQATFEDDSQMKSQLGGIVGISRDIQTLVGDEGRTGEETVFFLFPSERYVPRSFAYGGGERKVMVINANRGQESGEVYAHEKVHDDLQGRFGTNYVGILTEGAALHFANQEFPGGPVNLPEKQFMRQDVIRTITQAVPTSEALPLSHLDLVRNPLLAANSAYTNEFQYPYGQLVVDFLISRYGQDKFLEVYKLSSSKNFQLVDPATGKKVIEIGLPNATESEIFTAALRNAGISLSDFKSSFKNHVGNLSKRK